MAKADTQLQKIFRDLGFKEVRRGKHATWRHPNGTQMTVPLSIGRGRGFANAVALAKRLARK